MSGVNDVRHHDTDGALGAGDVCGAAVCRGRKNRDLAVCSHCDCVPCVLPSTRDGVEVIHYHGTPITPRSVLHQLAGRNFCVPFANPNDIKICHQIGQSVMLDNSAYTVWKQGIQINWPAWREWVEPWLDYSTTWCVLPDSIEGDEYENDRLLVQWTIGKGSPVWHLHESLDRLERLCATYEKVCFGSSGSYAIVGTDQWRRRVTDAFDRIAEPSGRVPWIHMLRGMKLSGDEFPFGSVDSADIGRNHYLPHNNAVKMADRWDALQTPGRWVTHRQMTL